MSAVAEMPKEQKYLNRSKLAHKVWLLVWESDLPMTRIAADCDVSYPWLFRFRGTAFDDMPSVDRLERLYEYLTGKTLEF